MPVHTNDLQVDLFCSDSTRPSTDGRSPRIWTGPGNLLALLIFLFPTCQCGVLLFRVLLSHPASSTQNATVTLTWTVGSLDVDIIASCFTVTTPTSHTHHTWSTCSHFTSRHRSLHLLHLVSETEFLWKLFFLLPCSSPPLIHPLSFLCCPLFVLLSYERTNLTCGVIRFFNF